ncbi:MAG: hypothetical protein HYZ28_22770 [Myxococcales bacterium]|nr:hypothetical protein [Myxococcales bacterium]
MGSLGEFAAYLEGRIGTVEKAEAGLLALQQKYETFFQEVSRVREEELAQLTAHVVSQKGKLPGWLEKAIGEARAAVEQEYDRKLALLRLEHQRVVESAEGVRQSSRKLEQELRAQNSELDAEEEQLKARNQALLARIEEYNRRIRALGSGFGFFSNLFKMRQLEQERRALDREHADLSARIETLRAQWASAAGESVAAEGDLQTRWKRLQDEAAAMQVKVEHLETSRPRIALRSTMERVLFTVTRGHEEPGPGDPPCPRCKARNRPAQHFCHACAIRLSGDRPDLEGSLPEIAELNQHFLRFSEGMKGCQEIIGLVRGLRSGLQSFIKSVESMRDTERRHPVSALRIEVPQESIQYGKNLDALFELSKQDLSLHPQPFATQVRRLVEQVFGEAQLKGYFERMGQELSTQANAQW